MEFSICYDNNINDSCENMCRVCKNKSCDNCLGKIQLQDKNATFSMMRTLPILYRCSFDTSDDEDNDDNDSNDDNDMEIINNNK